MCRASVKAGGESCLLFAGFVRPRAVPVHRSQRLLQLRKQAKQLSPLLGRQVSKDSIVEATLYPAQPLQQSRGLPRKENSFGSSIDRIRPPLYPLAGLEPVQKTAQASFAEIKNVRELGLRGAILPGEKCNHPPLRAGDTVRSYQLIERGAA